MGARSVQLRRILTAVDALQRPQLAAKDLAAELELPVGVPVAQGNTAPSVAALRSGGSGSWQLEGRRSGGAADAYYKDLNTRMQPQQGLRRSFSHTA